MKVNGDSNGSALLPVCGQPSRGRVQPRAAPCLAPQGGEGDRGHPRPAQPRTAEEDTAGQGEHSVIFPTGVVHRVENGWGLTKVAVVLLNGLLW